MFDSALVIIGIVLFIFGGLLLILGTKQNKKIGPLVNFSLNNMTDEELENLDGSPYYHQSGIIFWLLAIVLVLQGAYVVFKYNPVFIIIEIMFILALTIYGVTSTVKLKKTRNQR